MLAMSVGCGNSSPVVGAPDVGKADVGTTDVSTTDVSTTDASEVSIDTPVMCAMGQQACAGRCVDVTSDSNNCGMCGTAMRVGRKVGSGSTTGNFYQINDCSSGDAACWYGRFISQNDGDTFGAWLTNGGNWGFVPSGCVTDQCPTSSGDRDHSVSQRIAIFGGDCYASCNNGIDDVRNGLVYRDFGDATNPSRVGNRGWWGAGTVTSGSTALGTTSEIADYGQTGTMWRDLWIR